jgi:hypothetical protein
MVGSFPIDLAACCADGEPALIVQRSRWDAVDHFGSRCLSEQSVAHGAVGERPDPIGYAESWHEVRTHAAIAPLGPTSSRSYGVDGLTATYARRTFRQVKRSAKPVRIWLTSSAGSDSP